MGEVEMRKSWK